MDFVSSATVSSPVKGRAFDRPSAKQNLISLRRDARQAEAFRLEV